VASDGNIIVTDVNNHRVQIFDQTGKFLKKFGAEGKGNNQFQNPFDVCMNSLGFIYVAGRQSNSHYNTSYR
jgi:hypothetical protein